MLQRGRALSSAEIQPVFPGVALLRFASTGPRSFERGNSRPREPSWGSAVRFNGAALFRARKFKSGTKPAALALASTGPRSFERGNKKEADDAAPLAAPASTGPRSFERGNS